MIERIISFSLKNKFIIGLFVIGLIGWGAYSVSRLPIDAVPDITNNQVQVISLAPSLAVQEVESFITAPIEVSVANIPDIIELRSISRLGLSVVTVVFKDNVDIYWARQQINERLKEAEDAIPRGVADIELAPISTGLGEIYQYRLAVKKGLENKYSPMDLRTVQDWIVRREMLGTKGVADINSYGGFVRQYEVAVDPDRLKSLNLTIIDVFNALEDNNENTGSAYIDKNPTAYFIRGIGLVKSMGDIEKIVVKSNPSGIPILIRDVANVRQGAATRYGALVIDTSEAVGGVIMMLKGENAHQVIDNVEERIKSIQKSLPDGIRIEPYLNRSDLVGRAIGTVSENLVIGALIVIFILVLFLGNLRAGLIVASVIPLSMLFAISMMNLFGVSGNLMSLGAIDFGLIVDGAVIIVESVVHRIYSSRHHLQGITKLTQAQMDENVFDSAKRMMSSATFGQVIILIVYLPIMALVGIEGKMFRPMAQVVAFALLGAAILSLTYVPAASSLFLSRKTVHKRNIADRLMDVFHRVFNPVIHYALDHKFLVTAIAVLIFVFSVFVFKKLGGEFIPQLEEGDLAAGVITLQGGSITNTVETVKKANKILLGNFPEIKHAVCKIGAAEIPTDPTPMETGDYIITLKPKKEWTSASSREELVEKMEDRLITLAGVKFEFQQPIQMRFNELMTGSKQDVAIKVFGDDLNLLAKKAAEIEQLIQKINGVEDINVEKVTGLAQVQAEYDRNRLAQYGISVKTVNNVLRAAFAGSQAGVVFDEEKRFGLVVRLDKDYRKNLNHVKNLAIPLPGGGQIPFEQIAKIEIKSGPAQVSRENTKRRITVGFNVRGRDVQTLIDEVTAKIDKNIKFPAGYYVTYGGQFKNLEAAKKRLFIAVPVALLLIFVLLFFTFHSVRQTLLIYTAVPFSAIGGILALWIRGMNFSISAGVGFIALFGVAVLNGIVLISEFNRLEKEGVSDIRERVLKGLKTRLRPVIMTAAVASLGFLPMALSKSAGAEVQKPLATVVIGGLITATLLTLIILPVFYTLFSSRKFKINFTAKPVKNTFLALILVISSAFLQNANAQGLRTLNVGQAVRLALDSNLSVQSAAISVNVQKALKAASWNIPKTELAGQYGQFNSFTRDNSFSVTQTLEFPMVYVYQNKMANAGIKNSGWQLSSARLEIATQVKHTYWQLTYLYSKQKLYKYQDSLYKGFFLAAEKKAKIGESTQLEMMTARSQWLQVANQLNKVNADLKIYYQKLKILLNTNSDFLIADSVLSKLELTIKTDSADLSGNPALSYMKGLVDIAGLEKKREISKSLPDLTFGYFSQTMQGTQDVNGTPVFYGRNDRFTGVQAGITVPLGYSSFAANNKAASLKVIETRTNARYFSQTLYGNFYTLAEENKKYLKSIEYFENQALPEANLIIEQSSLSYRAGAMDYIDFILSLQNALETRQNCLEELNNLNQNIISLEYLYGKIF